MKRLTIQIADTTFKALKIYVAERGTTLKEVITEAVENIVKKGKKSENKS